MTLWIEHDLLMSSLVFAAASADVIRERTSSHIMRFLMNLRAEFESVHASLLHLNMDTMEEVLATLLREDTRLRSQSKLNVHASDNATTFAVQGGQPQFHRTAKGEIICHYCKEPGHIQFHCKKRNSCNYCKQDGHLIGECPTLARRGQGRGNSSRGGPQLVETTYAMEAASPSLPSLIPDDVCRMVQEALKESLPSTLTSAFATGNIFSSPAWHIDSAAYKHMTNSRTSFAPLNHSVPHLALQVASGSTMTVCGVGCVVHPNISIPDTLYVPKLFPSLVSVVQLTDDGFWVIFYADGCTVQDTRTGKEIGRVSKNGMTFMLDHY
ncbi:unnamed protein product [Linum trigynum]|uniref:CCHC-type domain-containing protein n=1 Tax=Linum trigynum TaxID=586398 RepID=A0AAV2E7M7_9ROSI